MLQIQKRRCYKYRKEGVKTDYWCLAICICQLVYDTLRREKACADNDVEYWLIRCHGSKNRGYVRSQWCSWHSLHKWSHRHVFLIMQKRYEAKCVRKPTLSLFPSTESLEVYTQLNQMQEGGESSHKKQVKMMCAFVMTKLQVKWGFWELGGGTNVRIPLRALTLIQ